MKQKLTSATNTPKHIRTPATILHLLIPHKATKLRESFTLTQSKHYNFKKEKKQSPTQHPPSKKNPRETKPNLTQVMTRDRQRSEIRKAAGGLRRELTTTLAEALRPVSGLRWSSSTCWRILILSMAPRSQLSATQATPRSLLTWEPSSSAHMQERNRAGGVRSA
jgi:hypothetical protein